MYPESSGTMVWIMKFTHLNESPVPKQEAPAEFPGRRIEFLRAFADLWKGWHQFAVQSANRKSPPGPFADS
jgi:hypothetical protein